MAYKTEYSRYDNKTGLISTVGSLDAAIATLPTEGDTLIASDGSFEDNFGNSVAVGNNLIVVGAPYDDDNGSNSGSVYIFDLDGNQLAKITASDSGGSYLGSAVAIGNGKIAATAAGALYIYDLDGTN